MLCDDENEGSTHLVFVLVLRSVLSMSAAIVFVSWAIVCREEERRATAPVVREAIFVGALFVSFLSRH